MIAKICFGRHEAVLDDDANWHCDNSKMQELLEVTKETWLLTSRGYHPNPWVQHAEYAAEEMGGKVLYAQNTESAIETVY